MNFGSPLLDFLNEAPGDDNQGNDQNATPPADNNDADTDEGFQQAPDDNGNNDNNADQGNQDTTTNEDNDDFNIDAEDTGGDDTGDAGGDTDNAGDTSGNAGQQQGASGEANVDTAAKKKDREIFDTLSPEEQKIKTVKLKELYIKLYSRCDQVIEKFNTLGVEYEDLIDPIKNTLAALYSIKESIAYWLLYLFDSKNYIENDIMFNRYLTAMNQIKLITKSMIDSHKKEIEDVKNNKPLNDKDLEYYEKQQKQNNSNL